VLLEAKGRSTKKEAKEGASEGVVKFSVPLAEDVSDIMIDSWFRNNVLAGLMKTRHFFAFAMDVSH
jgi:hypothetical protein